MRLMMRQAFARREGARMSAATQLRTSDHEAPRVAVIGAGLLGLTAGYRLAQHGVSVTVYEATGSSAGWRARRRSTGSRSTASTTLTLPPTSA